MSAEVQYESRVDIIDIINAYKVVTIMLLPTRVKVN